MVWTRWPSSKNDRDPPANTRARIEGYGAKVDPDYLARLINYVKTEAEKVKEIIYDQIEQALEERVEFNIGSPLQLADVLFNRMGLPVLARSPTTKEPSTGKDVLEKLADEYPVCHNVAMYRSMTSNLSKMAGDIIKNVNPHTGRVHTNYNQTGATTGRFSSSEPNMQNVSKMKEWKIIRLDGSTYKIQVKPRDVVVAEDDYYLIEFDYAQIEYIIMAALSGEDKIVRDYLAGLDVHKQTASEVAHVDYDDVTPTLRRKAKTWNYLLLYGGGAKLLATRNETSEAEAERDLAAFYTARPKMQQWSQRTRDRARVIKKVVTHFGRWQVVPEFFMRGKGAASKAERASVNRIVQGTAADYHKTGLVKTPLAVSALWPEDLAKLILQTHDSQTWEIHKSVKPQDIIPIITEAMSMEIEGLPRIKVDAEIGISWATLKAYEPNKKYGKKWRYNLWKERQELIEKMGEPPVEGEEQLALTEEAKATTGIKIEIDLGDTEPTALIAKMIKRILASYPGLNVVTVGGHAMKKHATSLGVPELEELLSHEIENVVVKASGEIAASVARQLTKA